jgi:hypothetical protein
MAYCRVCGEEYSDARASLGYLTCLDHPEKRKEYIVSIPFNKGAYQLITQEEVKAIGRK